MIETSYDRGDAAKVERDFAGVDPDTVIFKVKDPANTLTTYEYSIDAEVIRAGVGNYYVDVDANLEGVWEVRWESVNPQTAHESAFIVKHSNFS